MLRDTERADIPVTVENWGMPVGKQPRRQQSEDLYKWVLIPGQPMELFRRPMTCLGRTWTLDTWARKLLTTPRALHNSLVRGIKAGKTIREVLIVDLKADMAVILGSKRQKKTSSAKRVQRTRNDDGGLMHERLTSIEKRRKMTRPTHRRLTQSRGRLSLSAPSKSGENLCVANN